MTQVSVWCLLEIFCPCPNETTWSGCQISPSMKHSVWVYACESEKPQLLHSNCFKVRVWNSHVLILSLCGPWQQHGASWLCQTDKTDSWKAVQPSINQREQERDSKSTDAFLPDNLRAHTHGPSSYERQHQQRKKNNHKTHPLIKKKTHNLTLSMIQTHPLLI